MDLYHAMTAFVTTTAVSEIYKGEIRGYKNIKYKIYKWHLYFFSKDVL